MYFCAAGGLNDSNTTNRYGLCIILIGYLCCYGDCKFYMMYESDACDLFLVFAL